MNFAVFLLVVGIIMIVVQSVVLSYAGDKSVCSDSDKRQPAITFLSILLVMGILMAVAGGYSLFMKNGLSDSIRKFVCV